jgi:hypothetical protein
MAKIQTFFELIVKIQELFIYASKKTFLSTPKNATHTNCPARIHELKYGKMMIIRAKGGFFKYHI